MSVSHDHRLSWLEIIFCEYLKHCFSVSWGYTGWLPSFVIERHVSYVLFRLSACFLIWLWGTIKIDIIALVTDCFCQVLVECFITIPALLARS